MSVLEGIRLYALINIPAHKGCKNCGKCCGVIPVNELELAEIEKYLNKHPEVRTLAIKQSGQITCPFRDEENQRCTIYPVRPIICRLCGIVKGMECAYGNSMEIDGRKFLPRNKSGKIMLLNDMDWKV